MYDRGNQSTRYGDGQAHETLLVHLDQAFCKNSRSRRLYIKASQAKGAAHQKHERDKEREVIKVAAFTKRRPITPGVSQHGRSKPKGNNIGNGVQLYTDL